MLPAVRATPGAIVILTGALLASGCGGGASQNAHEPKITTSLVVAFAHFPALQSIARPTSLVLQVRNAGPHAAPNVAVTIDSFDYAENFPELSSTQRPIWVVDRGPGPVPDRPAQSQAVSPPGGGQTAYTNTWALGQLPVGGVRTFHWRVVPVKSGLYTVTYTVSAGLAGNAKAVNVAGGPVQGHLRVYITKAPPPTQVNPNTGQVVPGKYPLTP
jgi:hypothetical protein